MTTENIVSVREAATAEIKAHLDNIGATYIKVGALLNELRGDFEGQKDFLAYVEAEFSIKKAQCYKLMSVARVFGEDDRFKGVAMRVMLALVNYADEGAIMDKAAELAADGKLDTKAVNELLAPSKPEPKQSQSASPKSSENAAGAESEVLQNVPEEDDSNPWDDGEDSDTAPEVSEVVKPVNVELPKQPEPQGESTKALLDTIKQLNETIAELQGKLAARESEREARKSAAPMLPQFKSKCMYARLGLSAEEAEKKTAVTKARRELVKLGYGEGHEAWEFIKEAVEALTK